MPEKIKIEKEPTASLTLWGESTYLYPTMGWECQIRINRYFVKDLAKVYHFKLTSKGMQENGELRRRYDLTPKK